MKDEVKQSLVQLQMLHGNIKQVKENMDLLEKQVSELSAVVESLKEFNSLKEGNEILVQLAGGIFTTAKLVDPQNLKVNVGSGVVVEKSVDDTKGIIESQVADLQKVQLDLHAQLHGLVQEFEKLQGEVQDVQVSKGQN
ncbi:prefoldin subunit alpha [Nanoarchaeota archaeon]